MSRSVPKGQVSVITLVRGEEHYVFVFHPQKRTELLRLLGRYAADPNLSFNWYDAAVLSQRIREMMPAEMPAEALPPTAVDSAECEDGFEPNEFGSSMLDRSELRWKSSRGGRFFSAKDRLDFPSGEME